MSRYPNPDRLMAEAVQESGLADFGPGDFREGLAVLLDSLERDGDFDPPSDADVIGALRRRLSNRLEVEAWYADHPQIEQLPLPGPVDINGLPRTGTTALANMMSLDPQLRSLRGWEQAKPCPPPKLEDEANDPRRLQAIQEDEEIPAELKAMHLYDVNATMEDTELLGMAFHGQQFTLPVYSYHAWWRRTDMTVAYSYHRRVLKLLQSQRPPNLWLFKAPHHNFHLEAVAAAFPGTRFIMTHRDPAKSVPSWSSLVSAVFPPPEGERDRHRLGHEVSAHLRVGVQNAMAARARLGEDRFLDVHHPELIADPMGVLRRIYAFLDLELTPAVEQTILDWTRVNRSGTHGAHVYTAEQFGLSEAQLHADYDEYIQHFGIEIER
jgi:hypothetical protein